MKNTKRTPALFLRLLVTTGLISLLYPAGHSGILRSGGKRFA